MVGATVVGTVVGAIVVGTTVVGTVVGEIVVGATVVALITSSPTVIGGSPALPSVADEQAASPTTSNTEEAATSR